MYNNASIHFPPGTVSSKLSSKMLKKPPSPVNWIHQSYMETIQETNHSYETLNRRSDALRASMMPTVPESVTTLENDTFTLSERQGVYRRSYHRTVMELFPDETDERMNNTSSVPLCLQEEEEEEEYDDDEDSDDEGCNTITTSSTDCNRKNNIYQYYRDQQKLICPVDEDDDMPVCRVLTPHSSNYGSDEDHSRSEMSSKSSMMVADEETSKQKHKLVQPFGHFFKGIGRKLKANWSFV